MKGSYATNKPRGGHYLQKKSIILCFTYLSPAAFPRRAARLAGRDGAAAPTEAGG